jgi:hypothetical protein
MYIKISKLKQFGMIIFLLISLSLIPIFNINLYAKTDSTKISDLWVDLNLGPALGSRYLNVMTSGIKVYYLISPGIFSAVRFDYSTDDLSGNQQTSSGLTGTIIKDFGGLFGYIENSGDFQYTAATGITYIIARYPKETYFNAINFPLEFSIIYSGPLIGFGITAFDNINSKITYFGLMLTFRLKVK